MVRLTTVIRGLEDSMDLQIYDALYNPVRGELPIDFDLPRIGV